VNGTFACDTFGIGAFPKILGTQAFGAHCNMGLGGSGALDLDLLPSSGGSHTGTVRTETYLFDIGTDAVGSDNPPLVPGQVYCITWHEIVLKLTSGPGVCSDCLMGGWGLKWDDTAGTADPTYTEVNDATSFYDPVHLGTLTTAASSGTYGSYHNSNCAQCETVASGNHVGNTAGCEHGSASEWNEKCVEFTCPAGRTEVRIHAYAITDFNACTGCIYSPTSTVWGTYVGITKFNINVTCATNCSCV